MASYINYTIEISKENVNVYRSNKEDSSDIVGYSTLNTKLLATKKSDDGLWYYVPAYEGWIKSSNFRITSYSKPTSGVFKDNPAAIIQPPNMSNVASLMSAQIVDPNTIASGGILDTMTADNTNGIFAIPYQFMSSVDRRVKDNNHAGVGDGVGRKFAEKILARNNLIYIQAGKCEFLPGSSDADKTATVNSLLDESAPNTTGRYYNFTDDMSTYWKYVNTAAHATATLMGIQNVSTPLGQIGNIAWQNALENEYARGILNVDQNIVFYMDGVNSISDDYGNSTRESQLVSQINGYSDTVKEINYLLGYGKANSDLLNDSMEGFESAKSTLNQAVEGFTSGSGVLGALLGNANTILSGGKLVFPEMWSDSDYDRSYSIDIKLRSPEADEVSIYMNIIVPLIHLIALTAPRDFVGGGSNGYMAPFLVRAYVRSLFNIDLGIITSLSVNKGGEANWSAATNLPTSVDVSISIKDLYKSMFITEGSSSRLIADDAELEQLMTLSGVPYYRLNPAQKFEMFGGILEGNVAGIIPTVESNITTHINQYLSRFYN